MAVAFVQATAKANSASIVGSLTTAAFGSQPTINSHIIMVAWFGQAGSDPGTFTFSDNQASGGNSYTTSVTGPNVTSNGRVAIGVAQILKSSGSFTVTASSSGTGFCAAQAWEVSGLKNVANPTDQTNTSGPTTSTTASSGAVTPTESNEFIVAGFTDNSAINSAISAPSGSGWVGQVKEEDASNFQSGAGAYRIASGIQSENTTWTITSFNWGGAIATYKAAPAGVTSTVYSLLQWGQGV